MKHYFPTFAALTLSFMGGVLAPVAKADEWNKRTKITINQPIALQDTVLPAGSYVIQLLDLPSARNVVQIFNAEENHVIATVLAVPAERFKAADHSDFKFYESEIGQPPALRTWFYPGDISGFQFRPGRGAAAAESARSATNLANSSAGAN